MFDILMNTQLMQDLSLIEVIFLDISKSEFVKNKLFLEEHSL